MFTYILFPTVGSELSNTAIQQGIQFARSLNAKATRLHVNASYASLYMGLPNRRVRAVAGGRHGQHGRFAGDDLEILSEAAGGDDEAIREE